MTRSSGIAAIALMFLAALLCAAATASADEPPVGTRVRVTLLAHPDAPIIGSLLAYRPDSLALAVPPDSTRRAYALSDISRLERSTGTTTKAAKGAVIGAVAGGIGAALLGALFASAIKEGENTEIIPIAMGAGGAVVGGLVGAAVGEGSKRDKWEEVPR